MNMSINALEKKMYILVLAVGIAAILHLIIRKIKSRKTTCQPPAPTENSNAAPHRNIRGFLLFSLLLIVLGLMYIYNGYKYIYDAEQTAEHGIKTTAVITYVRKYEVYDNDGDYNDYRDVYVTYTANNQQYEYVFNKAGIYGSVGSRIEVYYLPETPEEIVSLEHVKNKVSFRIHLGVIMCIIPFAIGIYEVILTKRAENGAKKE